MNNIGGVYSDKGKLDLALEYYLKDKEIEENLGLEKTSGYADLMYNLGILYEKKGNKNKAGKRYREAYYIYQKLGLEDKAKKADKWAKESGC